MNKWKIPHELKLIAKGVKSASTLTNTGKWDLVAQAFNLSTGQEDLCEFETNLVFKVSFWISRITETQKKTCLKNNNKQKQSKAKQRITTKYK